MTLEESIYAALATIATTFATVALDVAAPYIVYQLVAGMAEPSYDADGNGAEFGRWQVDCWHTSYGAARALATQARDKLYNSVVVGEVTDNPSDYDPVTKLHKASFDVKAWV